MYIIPNVNIKTSGITFLKPNLKIMSLKKPFFEFIKNEVNNENKQIKIKVNVDLITNAMDSDKSNSPIILDCF